MAERLSTPATRRRMINLLMNLLLALRPARFSRAAYCCDGVFIDLWVELFDGQSEDEIDGIVDKLNLEFEFSGITIETHFYWSEEDEAVPPDFISIKCLSAA